KQAALDVTFSTLRVGGMLTFAALGLGAWGVIEAWVGAAALVLLVAMALVGLPRGVRPGAAGPLVGPMVRYFASLALYLLVVNLIMSVDTFLLKRLITEWFHVHSGLSGLEEAAVLADKQVAHYRVVQNLARLPYQLMIAVTFVVFPLVSRATFE